MKYILGFLMGFLLCINGKIYAQTIDFNGYSSGLSPSVPYATLQPNSPQTTVTMSFLDNTDKLIGGTPVGVGSGTSAAPYRLNLTANFDNTSQYITVKFTFSQPVKDLSFNMTNVDLGTTSGSGHTFQDQVTITTDNSGNSPSITSGTGGWSSVSGNVITGIADATDNSLAKNPKVTINYWITELTITWTNGPQAISNPTQQTIGITNISLLAPLPVKLISFDGQKELNNISLRWQTTEEINFDHFEVERSFDMENFTTINSTEIHSVSEGLYRFDDVSPAIGINYYRLKMVDIDGSVNFSKAISVIYEGDTPFVLYPNPTSELINFSHVVLVSFDNYAVYTNNNRLVEVGRLEAEELNIKHLQAGNYWIVFYSNKGNRLPKRFIKL